MVSDTDNRASTVKAKASEILSRRPTAEELAENEARAKANRLATIMEPPAPIVRRVNENALVSQDARPVTRGHLDRTIDHLLNAFAAKLAEQHKRIEALEAAAKPRHRVKALTRPAA